MREPETVRGRKTPFPAGGSPVPDRLRGIGDSRSMTSHPNSEQSASFPSGRLAGLDALRGGAMLLGILLHAAVAYMPTKMPHMLWPVFESQTSWICDVVFWATHTFRLPLFFFLSGFLTEQLYQTRGARAFIDQRIRRLVIPYLIASFTVLPVTLVVWTLGWIISGRCTLDEALNPLTPFGGELGENYFNPGHLWFLLDLTIFNAVYFVFRLEWPGENNSEHTRRLWLSGTWVTPMVLAAPSAMLLWNSTSPLTEFHNSFLPDSARLMYYGLFFTFGAHAFRTREFFGVAIRNSTAHLMAAMVSVTISMLFFQPVVAGSAGLWERGVYSWSVALAAWFSILGFLGIVIHSVRADHPRVRYLADSSYWMFLIHIPIVGLAQIAMRPLAWAPEFKMLAAFGVAVMLSLSSYAVFVRHTVIGFYLHGRRDRAATTDPAPHASEPQASLRRAA